MGNIFFLESSSETVHIVLNELLKVTGTQFLDFLVIAFINELSRFVLEGKTNSKK